jgi:hypothetical protein
MAIFTNRFTASPGLPPMTAQEALAEIDKVVNRLRGLDENLQDAMSDPGSEATPRLQQQISEALRHQQRLLDRLEASQPDSSSSR